MAFVDVEIRPMNIGAITMQAGSYVESKEVNHPQIGCPNCFETPTPEVLSNELIGVDLSIVLMGLVTFPYIGVE